MLQHPPSVPFRLAAPPAPALPAPAPFASAEGAWFWACAALRARREATRGPPGPCRVDEVVKCLDDLYRRRRIELLHVRILRIWGERGTAPSPAQPRQRCDWRLWQEALERLDWPLRMRGIVGGGPTRPGGP